MNIQKQPGAYILSHNGLGDNITMIGAIRFLSNYYETIYFLCKDKYESNVKLFFKDINVVTIPFDSNNEVHNILLIMSDVIQNKKELDFFISGDCNTRYLKSKITHPMLLNYKQNDKTYKLKIYHIWKFYRDARLDLSIYCEWFDISSSRESKQLYEEIQTYKIIFAHTKSSAGEINLGPFLEQYKNKENYIIICANKNMYDASNPHEQERSSVCEKYINIPVAHYIDIIKNANIIHIVNSCFSCIIVPLMMTQRLNSINTVIHDR